MIASLEAIDRSRQIHAKFRPPARRVNWIVKPPAKEATPVAPQYADAHVRAWRVRHVTFAQEALKTPFRRMLDEVAVKHGVSVDDIRGRRRLPHIVVARQEAMWIGVRVMGLSMPICGAKLGGRDHTTVLHGVRAHEKRVGR